ncbi:MAG: S41 family peptidase [Bacteroidetes bacterium]|nr:S41 family peptidase [Bacteroidota bacterium]
MSNKKFQVWLPLLFSLVMIGGMFFGFQLNQQTGGSGGFFSARKPNTLQEALELIKTKYVDSVKTDSLTENAIGEMMNELDPHSIYIPANNLKEVNEDLIGNLEGAVGIEFNVFSDTVNVLYVLPDGPSDKAGLQIGDRIIKVGDSTIAGRHLSNETIKQLIRGEMGSKVQLTLFRNGQSISTTITRGSVPVPSLDASYMLDKTTGYIKLNKFSETTYREFMQALEGLQKQGMQALVLDLRGNGGGLMDEAVQIADEFLDDNKLIVYTQGNNSPKREYRARRDGLFEKGKLSVLVDELSASASEVLAGALQDWDRATIIGRRTFGKGLVQTQYELSDGSAIRLTVARYYTPLGRSIQRSYDKGKKVYMDEIWHRYQSGEMVSADSNKIENGKEYKTPKGTILYGGGGIMPNVFVPYDTSNIQRGLTRLYIDGTFNNYVYNYYIQHASQMNTYSNPSDFIQRFHDEDNMWKGFEMFAEKDSVHLNTISGKEKESAMGRLKAYLARFKWRNNGLYQVLNTDDPVIKAALQ